MQIKCDGSVREKLTLSLAISVPPSVSVGWALTGNSPNPSNSAIGVVGGTNPFPEDALLIGGFQAQMSLPVIGPHAEESDPAFAILRQGDLSFFAGRFGDDRTVSATSVIGTESDDFGNPVIPDAPLVIPKALRDRPGPSDASPGSTVCPSATAARPPPASWRRACRPTTFGTASESWPDTGLHLRPRAPDPLPAAGWCLLGGLAVPGLVARRRPD